MLGVRVWGDGKPALNLRNSIVKEPGREGMGGYKESLGLGGALGFVFLYSPF